MIADYPDDPDPLCSRIHAVDVVLHYIDRLDDALARYRAVVGGGDDRLPIHHPPRLSASALCGR